MGAGDLLGLGVDLGSSGLRLALVGADGHSLAERSSAYPRPFEDPEGWRQGLATLVTALPQHLRQRIGAIAIAGTSGILLRCSADGAPRGLALSYATACPEQIPTLAALVPEGGPAASASGSLARALRLWGSFPQALNPSQDLLRHQADWLMGWLLADWRWGEEANNLRLGWDQQQQRWAGSIAAQPWAQALPELVAGGTGLGPLAAAVAASLGLPPSCQVVAGSTDGNAIVLAAAPGPGDGVAVLGTTLVLKQFSPQPLAGAGVSNHRLGGQWLVGGASNGGAGVLRQFFSNEQLEQLSRQIDPNRPSGLALRPLPGRGERFPIDDPELAPVLGPRPVSDALYLQALLEGLTELERLGWQKLQELGAPAVQRVLSVGGGANNPQWRLLRQRSLQIPVLNRAKASAAAAMGRWALASIGWEQPAPPEIRHE
jgi:sugar (pentulose or hexulose) kinase